MELNRLRQRLMDAAHLLDSINEDCICSPCDACTQRSTVAQDLRSEAAEIAATLLSGETA